MIVLIKDFINNCFIISVTIQTLIKYYVYTLYSNP